jgi:hypothetical protein
MFAVHVILLTHALSKPLPAGPRVARPAAASRPLSPRLQPDCFGLLRRLLLRALRLFLVEPCCLLGFPLGGIELLHHETHILRRVAHSKHLQHRLLGAAGGATTLLLQLDAEARARMASDSAERLLAHGTAWYCLLVLHEWRNLCATMANTHDAVE